MTLILASQSPRRLDLLKSIGIENIKVIPANLDETPHKGEHPQHLAERLSYEKALKISQQFKDQAVLAADTVVACGRRIVEAPFSEEKARECLDMLSGKSHRVYTAICLISPQHKEKRRLVETRVTFKRLEEDEKEAYVKSKEGFGKAGGYAIQGYAAAFVKRLNGSYTSILGLPLFEVRNLLKGLGLLEIKKEVSKT